MIKIYLLRFIIQHGFLTVLHTTWRRYQSSWPSWTTILCHCFRICCQTENKPIKYFQIHQQRANPLVPDVHQMVTHTLTILQHSLWPLCEYQVVNCHSPLGSYAYLSSIRQNDDQQLGRIHSPIIPAYSSKKCLTFYYQLNGRGVYYLDVHILLQGPQQQNFIQKYWRRFGHQGNYWQRGAVSITSWSNPYRVMFKFHMRKFFARHDILRRYAVRVR